MVDKLVPIQCTSISPEILCDCVYVDVFDEGHGRHAFGNVGWVGALWIVQGAVW